MNLKRISQGFSYNLCLGIFVLRIQNFGNLCISLEIGTLLIVSYFDGLLCQSIQLYVSALPIRFLKANRCIRKPILGGRKLECHDCMGLSFSDNFRGWINETSLGQKIGATQVLVDRSTGIVKNSDRIVWNDWKGPRGSLGKGMGLRGLRKLGNTLLEFRLLVLPFGFYDLQHRFFLCTLIRPTTQIAPDGSLFLNRVNLALEILTLGIMLDIRTQMMVHKQGPIRTLNTRCFRRGCFDWTTLCLADSLPPSRH